MKSNSKYSLRDVKSFLATFLNLPIIYSKQYFSQEGEDIILENIFKNKKDGSYVDVGAHHPFRYSNTQFLYLKGWTGINIEPTPNNIKLFDKTRKKDINIQTSIGKGKGKVTLYCFEDSAFNTTSKSRAKTTINHKQSKLVDKIRVKNTTLENIFNKHLNKRAIDLLNIDVEGSELDVLQTNNWKQYSPKVIVVENLNHDLSISSYLSKYDYNLIDKTRMSEIYKLT